MVKLVESEFNISSPSGRRTIYKQMDASKPCKYRGTMWRSPSIEIDRCILNEIASSRNTNIFDLLYEEIKIAEIMNMRKVISMKRQAALDAYRYVRKDRVEGFVYWVLNSADGLIKIGCSNNPERRLRELRNEHGAQLDILSTIPSTHMYIHEHMMHQVFASRRVYGEWFRIEEHHMRIWNYALKKQWVLRYI